jgi:glutamate-ammonia-ligase adenylyltransferase
VLRLLDPGAPRAQIEADLRQAGFHDPATSADALELAANRLPPEWVEEAIGSPDPDRALAQFRDLALRGSLGLFALLKEEPHLLRMLAGLFGTSERLSRHLVSHPALWVPLFDALGAPAPDLTAWRAALPVRLSGLDYEGALRELRRFQAEEILRIGLHDVAGNIGPDEVCVQLVTLAEMCLGATIELVAAQLEGRAGRPDTGLTVLALGSFGATEMRYGSDLDLVFLYGRPGTTSAGMDHQEWFARLAQRLIGALEALLEEGRLYEVDTRLRPSGAKGMLVTSYAGFDEYHQQDAAPWERVALLRARPVYRWPGPAADPVADFAPLLETIAYRHPLDEAALRRELVHMRARIEAERAGERGGALHLRFSAGGLTDLEFLAAWRQLRAGADDPGLRTTSPYQALAHLAARGDLAPSLLDDYRFLQRASLRLRLLRDRPDDRLAPADRPALARSLELGEAELGRLLDEHRARIRAAFRAALTG